MVDKYIAPDTLKEALKAIRGTANPMLKVWFVLKQMGFTQDTPVTINTSNSTESLERLFSFGSGDDTKRYFVPFAKNPSELTMAAGAARSQIQTNIKKFLDGTVGFDPRSFLQIEPNQLQEYVVGAQSGYPNGLGRGKDGFAKDDGQRVALPIRAWAVWYGRQTPIPSSEVDESGYLVRNMLDSLNIDEAEKVCIFTEDTDFALTFTKQPLSDDDINAIVLEALGSANAYTDKVYKLDDRVYERRLAAIRSIASGPRWLNPNPFDALKNALSLTGAVILFGPPRTGKTRAVRILYPQTSERETIQIHDGWSYENLMLGMKSVGPGEFKWQEGPLLRALRSEKKIIVLEEVNRTQLSQALGDVFSLLEPAYRGYEQRIRLRDGSEFWIEADVKFIFTMNTLDNSTEEVDDALFGRMAAVEFPPRVEDLRQMLIDKGFEEGIIDSLAELFVGVLTKYPLGHGYFAGMEKTTNPRDYYLLFIRPVLEKQFNYRKGELIEIDLLADQLFRSYQ